VAGRHIIAMLTGVPGGSRMILNGIM